MDKLPQELIDQICKSLTKKDLKNVLTLSTQFRYAAERYSEAFAEFKLTKDNTDQFLARYSGYRFSYLRDVEFVPELPALEYNEDETCRRETEDELRAKDECFTSQIQHLFKTLKTAEDSAGPRHSGKYRLSIHSPTRQLHENHCIHIRHVSWRVHLLRSVELPEISSVRSLVLHNYEREEHHNTEESDLDLRIMVDLATRFPNLEFLGCKTGGNEWSCALIDHEEGEYFLYDYEGPRRDARHGFAEAVSGSVSKLPSSLQNASLDFLYPFQDSVSIHHDWKLPNLVGSSTMKDPFSSSLRMLSNNLRRLRLRAMADETLFFPSGQDNMPSWPNLETLDVMFHIATPAGDWYFEGPGGEGSDAIEGQLNYPGYPPYEPTESDEEWDADDIHEAARIPNMNNNVETENQFRISPNEEKLRPFLESFAKAANLMPSLKRAVIWTPLSWDPEEGFEGDETMPACRNLAWGIAFVGQGLPPMALTPREEQQIPCRARQLWWRVGEWRPDSELHQLFRSIGSDRFGDDLVESWTDHEYGDELLHKAYFKDFFDEDDFGRIPRY